MSIEKLDRILRQQEEIQKRLSQVERLQAVQMLLRTSRNLLRYHVEELSEQTAADKRRASKRRETEVDPKSPVKPVRVAEPYKPKKPKYSGNHAPSAPK